MGKRTSFRLSDEAYSFLQLESEKQNTPVSDIIRKMIDDIISGNPILTTITDIDIRIKQKNLDVVTERARKLKNDNDFFDQNGYYPTKPRVFVEKIVQQEPAKKIWEGSGFQEGKQEQVSSFAMPPKKEPTAQQLQEAYDYLTNDLPSGKFGCQACAQVFENKTDMPNHFHKLHANQLTQYLKRFEI